MQLACEFENANFNLFQAIVEQAAEAIVLITERGQKSGNAANLADI